MSERLTHNATNVESYQKFVLSTRNDDFNEEWKIRSSEYLNGEMIEVLTQHGGAEAVALFLPNSFVPGYSPNDISDCVRYAVADELGDSLWFTVDILNRIQSDIPSSCLEAFESFGINIDDPINTFADIQQIVTNNADAIRYISKAGLIMGYNNIASTPMHFITSIQDNPLLHITRTNRKLARSLEEGNFDVAPYASGADLEPVSDIPLAAGQHLLSIAWLAHNRLGVTLNGIASFNYDKLLHRQSYGKENDIHFNDSYANL